MTHIFPIPNEKLLQFDKNVALAIHIGSYKIQYFIHYFYLTWLFFNLSDSISSVVVILSWVYNNVYTV